MNTYLLRLLGCLFMLFFTQMLNAQTYSETLEAYEHLFEVNKEWKHFEGAAPIQKLKFANDTKRIRFHLEAVINHLSKLRPAKNTIATQKKRALLLAELQKYAKQEIFPQNKYHSNRQPYFIDHKGTHCAVGYLMKVSGAGALAQQISKEHNYDYLSNIKTDGVLDWAEQHGFSLNELAWIQPTYSTNILFEELGKGTNGPVNKMVKRWDQLYIVGDFDLLDSLPCLNIGLYELGQLSCLGNGLDGKINDISYDETRDRVVVVGDLIDGGVHYPIATYQVGNGWTFQSISGRPNAKGVHIEGTYNLKISITDPTIMGTEIWGDSANTWKHFYTFHGDVLDMDNSWYVGLFDSLTMHRVGMSDTLFYTHNAVSMGANYPSVFFSTADTLMPDTIQTVESNFSITYFGGYSGNSLRPNLTRLLNNTLQPLLFEQDLSGSAFGGRAKIFDLELDFDSGKLYIIGDIEYMPFLGTSWNSIVEYNTGTGLLKGYNSFNHSIRSVSVFEGDLVIGGAFTSMRSEPFYAGSEPLNYLAKMYTPNAVHLTKNELPLNLFPNPTSSTITIDLGNDYIDVSVEVSNVLGQVVYQEEYLSTNTINLSLEGVSGMYLVKVKSADSESIVKVVKR